jgi:hypothetical protein
MEQISTIKELLGLWPSRQIIAVDVGAKLDAVHKWPLTNSIPSRYHAALLESAVRNGVALTAEKLAQLHDHRIRQVENPAGPALETPNEDAA